MIRPHKAMMSISSSFATFGYIAVIVTVFCGVRNGFVNFHNFTIFSFLNNTNATLMSNIMSPSTPLKIVVPIVRFVGINVVKFKQIFRVLNKMSAYKSMNSNGFNGIAIGKPNVQISMIVNLRVEKSIPNFRKYVSMVSNLVSGLITDNIFECFHVTKIANKTI